MSTTASDDEDKNELEGSFLMSTESMNRASPLLWEAPGVTSLYANSLLPSPPPPGPSPPLALSPDDISLLNRFSALSGEELIEEVKRLQHVAYQLAVEENKQITRGKYLQVLKDPVTDLQE